MTSPTDINSTLQNGVRALGNIAQTLSNAFPQVFGTFTLANAVTTNVAQPGIVAAGFPIWVATNGTAALTLRTLGLSLAAVTAGVGFTVSVQTGTAAGGETFSYFVYNPV